MERKMEGGCCELYFRVSVKVIIYLFRADIQAVSRSHRLAICHRVASQRHKPVRSEPRCKVHVCFAFYHRVTERHAMGVAEGTSVAMCIV